MNKQLLRARLVAGLALALAALGGAAFFYWRTLLDETVFTRAAIPASELSPAAHGAAWHVPSKLLASRWHRTGVRVWESGHALPWRVQHEDMITEPGRFCVSGEVLSFSASDQSNPLSNGRKYEFEVHRPNLKVPVLTAGLLFLAAALLVTSLEIGVGFRRIFAVAGSFCATFFSRPESGAPTSRAVGCVCLLIACLGWVLPHVGLHRRLPIPPEAIVQERDGHFAYNLARWIRRNPTRVNEALLSEDGKPLVRVSSAAITSPRTLASYVPNLDQICFRIRDTSAPAVNGRIYLLEVPLITGEKSSWCAMIIGTLGLVFFGRGVAAEPAA